MKSALATMTPSAPPSGTASSASIAYERPWMRGIMPRWMFCDVAGEREPGLTVGSGGRMP